MSKGHTKVPKAVKLKQAKMETLPKRKPGRPPGAKNKPKVKPLEVYQQFIPELESEEIKVKDVPVSPKEKRGKGRPKGSKNKPKNITTDKTKITDIIKIVKMEPKEIEEGDSDDEKLSEIASKGTDIPPQTNPLLSSSENIKAKKVKTIAPVYVSHTGPINERKVVPVLQESVKAGTKKPKIKQRKQIGAQSFYSSEKPYQPQISNKNGLESKMITLMGPGGTEETEPNIESGEMDPNSTSVKPKSRRGKMPASLQRSMSIETLDVIGVEDQLVEGTVNISLLSNRFQRGRGRGRRRGRGRGRGLERRQLSRDESMESPDVVNSGRYKTVY